MCFKKLSDNKSFIVIKNNYDYEYYKLSDDYRYKCSLGEEEYIDFLANIYLNNSNIIMYDEPCTHLSSQNKKILKDRFKTTNKQLIIITHDIEIIDIEQNILYFINNNGKTTMIHINKLEDDLKKHLSTHMELLFSKYSLFVEGVDDVLFFKALCEIENINKYIIIPMGGNKGCEKYHDICKKLNIEYKFVMDFDTIYTNNETLIHDNNIEILNVKQKNKIKIKSDKNNSYYDKVIDNCLLSQQVDENKIIIQIKNLLQKTIQLTNFADHNMCSLRDECKKINIYLWINSYDNSFISHIEGVYSYIIKDPINDYKKYNINKTKFWNEHRYDIKNNFEKYIHDNITYGILDDIVIFLKK